jgi:hypothetical protein
MLGRVPVLYGCPKLCSKVERLMTMNERQIALSVLESLRGDLVYAHLNNGSRVLDVADLRQYIYEQMNRIRTSTLVTDGLYGTTPIPAKPATRVLAVMASILKPVYRFELSAGSQLSPSCSLSRGHFSTS